MEFYSLAIEENGSYTLLKHDDQHMEFKTKEEAKEFRASLDCNENIFVAAVEILLG